MDLISKKRLYEKIARLEMEAKNKLAKTPRDSEEYIRYETQFNERSAFKHMVMDEREVDAVPVVRCKDCKHWGMGIAGETERIKCCVYARYMVSENGYCVYGEKV